MIVEWRVREERMRGRRESEGRENDSRKESEGRENDSRRESEGRENER